jgi:hypothetical protein
MVTDDAYRIEEEYVRTYARVRARALRARDARRAHTQARNARRARANLNR